MVFVCICVWLYLVMNCRMILIYFLSCFSLVDLWFVPPVMIFDWINHFELELALVVCGWHCSWLCCRMSCWYTWITGVNWAPLFIPSRRHYCLIFSVFVNCSIPLFSGYQTNALQIVASSFWFSVVFSGYLSWNISIKICNTYSKSYDT